jgi:hypothetical protein
MIMPIHDWTRVPAGTFHHFHQGWLTHLSDRLNDGLLPDDCYAMAEQVAGELGPDVLTLQEKGEGNGEPHPINSTPGGASLCTLTTTPPRVRFTISDEAGAQRGRRRRLVIHHSSDDRIIAILEVVSPGNKASRSALRQFVKKAIGAINAGINLLVVDLFPPGRRDPQGIHWAIWQEVDESKPYTPPADKPLTLAAYVRDPVRTAYVEPVAVGDMLIDMPLFLDPVSYVNVPLEATYQTAWRGVPRRWREVLEGPVS